MRSRLPKNAILIPDNAERVFKGIIYDVYHWPQQMFDGSTRTFEMLKRADTVVVIAVRDDKLVVLEEQQPNLPPGYGLPGGQHTDEAEDELQAARRELREETGLEFGTWKLLNVKQPAHRIEHFVYIFLATDFERQSGQKLDSGEKISVKLLDFDEAKHLLLSAESRFPNEEIAKASSIDDLLHLPEYHG